MPPTSASVPVRSGRTGRAATSILRRCRRRYRGRRIRQNSGVASDPSSSRRKGALDAPEERASWKDRYAALEARLADMKTAFEETRVALRASQERDQATRATLEKVRERLHWHERALLRPEVVADLMPARAQWRRETPPDEITQQREIRHRTLSDSYAEAHDTVVPAG